MDSLPLNTAARRSLTRKSRRAGLRFETGILEKLVEREPDNLDYLAALGEAYTRLRRYRAGLVVDQELVNRAPDDPIHRYNLACSQSLVGDLDASATSLIKSFELGYRDFDHLRRDPDLRRLRDDLRFALVQEHFEQHYGAGTASEGDLSGDDEPADETSAEGA